MRTNAKILITLLFGAVALAATIGCGDSKDPSASSSAPVTTTITSSTSTEIPKVASATSPTSDTAAAPAPATGTQTDTADAKDLPKAGEKVAVIETNLGQIVFKFLSDKAPHTVSYMKDLIGKKFFDGSKFHRVIPGFMIQGGDPNTKPGGEANGPPGTGGYEKSIDAEFNDTHHGPGTVSMARKQDPNSANGQFFICVADYPSLDGQYTAFGKVVKGMDVVNKIVNLPTGAVQPDMPNPGNEAVMTSVRVATWPLK
jgi:cyclophilin family peptidyl-prolyl cis-trans isomerase